MKNILVPIDFSDCSKAAAKFAMQMADCYGGRLTLVNVVHMPMVDPNMSGEMIEQMLEDGEKEARKSYELFKKELTARQFTAARFRIAPRLCRVRDH